MVQVRLKEELESSCMVEPPFLRSDKSRIRTHSKVYNIKRHLFNVMHVILIHFKVKGLINLKYFLIGLKLIRDLIRAREIF